MMLEHLRTFPAVARHLRLQPACDDLHLTPTAISKRLKALQDELGVKLCKPTRRGIELTDAGHGALTKIAAIVEQADELKASFGAANPQGQPAEIINVGAAFSLGAVLLPALITRFEKSHAGVHLRCHFGSSQHIAQMIHQGQLEIGLPAIFRLSRILPLSIFALINGDFSSAPITHWRCGAAVRSWRY